MPTACPWDGYGRRYKRGSVRRAHWNAHGLSVGSLRSSLEPHVVRAPNVKLPRASRGHLHREPWCRRGSHERETATDKPWASEPLRNDGTGLIGGDGQSTAGDRPRPLLASELRSGSWKSLNHARRPYDRERNDPNFALMDRTGPSSTAPKPNILARGDKRRHGDASDPHRRPRVGGRVICRLTSDTQMILSPSPSAAAGVGRRGRGRLGAGAASSPPIVAPPTRGRRRRIRRRQT